MGLLEDPEPRVVVAAAQVLRRVTGRDFGIKTTHALPQFTCIDTNPPPAPDLPAINQGVQRWRDWWTGHRAEYSAGSTTPPAPRRVAPFAAPDFSLEDSGGKPRRLWDFHGKTVLLVFWGPGAPASLNDVPALKALQQRYGERLAILGIAIPEASCCAGEHEHGQGESPEQAHTHHPESAGALRSADPLRTLSQRAVERLKINFPMLVDSKGMVGLRFNANDLPVYVLIDSDGRIRRRFVGFRTEEALAAMVEEAADSGPAAAKLSLGANSN